ncbi:hypothetical protein ACQY0O_007372 [Thecaphora frezii]
MASVVHISSLGTAFDALGLHAPQPLDQPPPPTFSEATALHSIHPPSIPIYIAPLRHRIAQAYERHTSLNQRLDDLGDVPTQIEREQQQMYVVSGRLTSQKARLKTLQADDAAAQRAYDAMVNSVAKRLINRRPARGSAVQKARSRYEAAHSTLEQHLDLISTNEVELARIKAELAELEVRKEEHTRLVDDLEHVNDSLFAGPTPEFPEEDLLEWEHNVLQETSKLLQAEANREKRARQLLQEASSSLQSCIKDLQTALQHCIDLGVPQNRKYSKQLFVGGSASSTVKATTSLVLRTKTNSGKFFTTIARARGSQALVQRAPEFTLIELHLMPGQRSPKAVDERGLHKSMESSYAQARCCETWLRSEIAHSLERQKKLREQHALLDARIKAARRELDAFRRRIVVAVVAKDETSLYQPAAAPEASSERRQSRVAFSTRNVAPNSPEDPVIVGTVRNEAILRETVLSHARSRSFSFMTMDSMARTVEEACEDVAPSAAQDDNDGDDGEGGEERKRKRIEREVAVQSTKDPNVAATVAMSAVTDVESPAERLRKEATKRLRWILARSVGTPESEELPSFIV